MNAQSGHNAYRVVGTRPVRPDGIDKVTGKALYGPDQIAPNMLHGAVLRSPHAHARIRGIDTSRAEALPGVKAVITARDFPGQESVTFKGGETSGDRRDIAHNCMALHKVLYAGHAVAAVAATSEAIAREALALIVVDLEVLPHVISVAEAIAPGAPVLHDDMFTEGLEPKPAQASNVSATFTMAKGDAAAAMARAAVVAEGRYVTQPVHQGYIEPQACVASWNSDGQGQIWCSSQGHFDVRNLTAGILNLPISSLRVTPLEIGGGFGGKTTVYLEPVAMVLSRKAGRPVRLAMRREEVFAATGPAPGSVFEVRIGADADGRLVALEMEFWNQSGAYPGNTLHGGCATALGAYNIADARATGWDVVSNFADTHAYRAPGAPQSAFAVESCIDEIALKLGMDPLELRLKNAVKPGDPSPSRLPHGAIGYIECLEAAKASPHWNTPVAEGESRGIAGAFWGNYGGPSTVAVSVASDGSVAVTTGSPDIGGSRASMAIMAAETLQVPYESVRVAIADTASLGYSMVTGGSRTTFATGKAVVDACGQIIDSLLARGAQLLGVEPGEVAWRDGAVHCMAAGREGEKLDMAAIAGRVHQFSGPVSAEVQLNAQGYLPGFGVHICDVAVDKETGFTRVTRYTAIQDVGRAIHPDYVEGQLQGGAAQGIGWALNEGYVFDGAGRVDNAGFLDYRMPVCSDLPMIETIMVEVPNPAHPYGVKGVGETSIVPPLAAVGNAVSRAVGKRMRDLPMAPEVVHRALAGA
ncbi:MAG: xanthine dehydrogenase family protein molybdopterin-binding subunit [Sphingomonadales bacterium]|nr:xanthine dehydrogenase family protein molybdopterin-binding subunit [Sphingomonadales bacterium]